MEVKRKRRHDDEPWNKSTSLRFITMQSLDNILSLYAIKGATFRGILLSFLFANRVVKKLLKSLRNDGFREK